MFFKDQTMFNASSLSFTAYRWWWRVIDVRGGVRPV